MGLLGDRNAWQTICSFSASVLAIFATDCLLGCKYAIFGDVPKTLIISCLNFVDTCWGMKMGLKGPKRACKRAVVGR